VERHQALKEDDVCWAGVGGLRQSGVVREGISRDFHSGVPLNKLKQGFVGEVEVDGIGVVKVVLANIDLIPIEA
jgi:hypothetical protein